MGLGITPLEPADRFQDFVALFQASLGDAVMELLEPLGQGPALSATHGPFLAAAWLAAGQQIVDFATLEKFDLDLGVVGQTLPTASALQVGLKLGQGVTACGQQITPAGLAEKGERILADHAAVHDPDAVGFAEAGLDVVDDGLDGLQVLGVAGPGAMGQGKTLAAEDQGEHDLLAIAAMVAGIAALGHVVVLGQAFEIGAGQVVEQQIVIELEESAELLLQVGFDVVLSLEELVERVIQTILGDGGVGHAEQVFQSGTGIPMLGQGELAARLAQAIDDFDGDDVGGRHGLFARRHMATDDGVEAEELPEPACQPHIAKAAGIAPTDLAKADADNIGIVGQGSVIVVGKETEFLSVALAVVKNHGALPTPFLVVIELAEMSDDALARSGIG